MFKASKKNTKYAEMKSYGMSHVKILTEMYVNYVNKRPLTD